MKLSFAVVQCGCSYSNAYHLGEDVRGIPRFSPNQSRWCDGTQLVPWWRFKEHIHEACSRIDNAGSHFYTVDKSRLMFEIGFESVDVAIPSLYNVFWDNSHGKYRLANRFIFDELFKAVPLYVPTDDNLIGGDTSLTQGSYRTPCELGCIRVIRHGKPEEIIKSTAMVIDSLCGKAWGFLKSKKLHAIQEKHAEMVKNKEAMPWANTYKVETASVLAQQA